MTCQNCHALFGDDAYAEHHLAVCHHENHVPSSAHLWREQSHCGSASRRFSFAACAFHFASASSPCCYFDYLLCQRLHLCCRCCAESLWTRAFASVSSLWAMLRNSRQGPPLELPCCDGGVSTDYCSDRRGVAVLSESAVEVGFAAWTLSENR